MDDRLAELIAQRNAEHMVLAAAVVLLTLLPSLLIMRARRGVLWGVLAYVTGPVIGWFVFIALMVISHQAPPPFGGTVVLASLIAPIFGIIIGRRERRRRQSHPRS